MGARTHRVAARFELGSRGFVVAQGLVRIEPGKSGVIWRNTLVTTSDLRRLGRGDLTADERDTVAERLLDEAYDLAARAKERPVETGPDLEAPLRASLDDAKAKRGDRLRRAEMAVWTGNDSDGEPVAAE